MLPIGHRLVRPQGAITCAHPFEDILQSKTVQPGPVHAREGTLGEIFKSGGGPNRKVLITGTLPEIVRELSVQAPRKRGLRELVAKAGQSIFSRIQEGACLDRAARKKGLVGRGGDHHASGHGKPLLQEGGETGAFSSSEGEITTSFVVQAGDPPPEVTG
jgi:hypothetical protein